MAEITAVQIVKVRNGWVVTTLPPTLRPVDYGEAWCFDNWEGVMDQARMLIDPAAAEELARYANPHPEKLPWACDDENKTLFVIDHDKPVLKRNLLSALDELYKKGWQDRDKEKDYDPRGTKEWQNVLELLHKVSVGKWVVDDTTPPKAG